MDEGAESWLEVIPKYYEMDAKNGRKIVLDAINPSMKSRPSMKLESSDDDDETESASDSDSSSSSGSDSDSDESQEEPQQAKSKRPRS